MPNLSRLDSTELVLLGVLGLMGAFVIGLVLDRWLLALFPARRWRLHGPEEPLSPNSVRAEARYGQDLRAAGFQRLGTLTDRPLFSRLEFDVWAEPARGMFASVSKSGLFVCNYFLPGPGVVLTGDYQGRVKRQTGYWTQYEQGGSVDALIQQQKDAVGRFQVSTGGPWSPWTDMTLAGKLAAENAFDGGIGRPALLKNAAMHSLNALVVVGYLLMTFHDVTHKHHRAPAGPPAASAPALSGHPR